MRVSFQVVGDLRKIMEAETEAAERAVTAGIRQSARSLQSSWRGQVTGAGLGRRLANTIRMDLYPDRDVSINAAAVVYSRAAKIVDAFERGALIRSPNGFYLAIPTDAAGRRGLSDTGSVRITPASWERRTGMKLRFVYRRGRHSLLVADDARVNKRGVAARKGGTRRKDGVLTGAQTVAIFTLVPQVRLRKRLDLERAANAALDRLPAAIVANWRDR